HVGCLDDDAHLVGAGNGQHGLTVALAGIANESAIVKIAFGDDAVVGGDDLRVLRQYLGPVENGLGHAHGGLGVGHIRFGLCNAGFRRRDARFRGKHGFLVGIQTGFGREFGFQFFIHQFLLDRVLGGQLLVTVVLFAAQRQHGLAFLDIGFGLLVLRLGRLFIGLGLVHPRLGSVGV